MMRLKIVDMELVNFVGIGMAKVAMHMVASAEIETYTHEGHNRRNQCQTRTICALNSVRRPHKCRCLRHTRGQALVMVALSIDLGMALALALANFVHVD